MDARFDQLRKKASQKRDQQIRAAKAEFTATCRQIDALERKLPVKGKCKVKGHRSRIRKPLTAYIMECISDGEPFTSPQLMAALTKRYPDRNARYDCLRRTVGYLKQHGSIKRIGFNDDGRVVYVLKQVSR